MRYLLVDHQTKRELEIFRSRDGGSGVFDLLDRCCTAGGRDALRRRFEAPLADVRAIREVQVGIRFLIENRIQCPIDLKLLDEVIEYLSSPWVLTTSRYSWVRFLESFWIALRYRELLRSARRGLAAIARLMDNIREFTRVLQELHPPVEVAQLAAAMNRSVARIGLGTAGARRGPWSVLHAERLVREERKGEVRLLLEHLYRLDALCSMAIATWELDLQLPEMVESDEFVMAGCGLYHPFLRDAVRNPIDLGNGAKILVLTGPNMSGKTTYLKAVGIAAFLAHLGMGVPC